ncbi:MAG: hypothetical protein QF541_09535 [Lentisphaeria bacterium]|nr:hypothetical protein [Lentisphaeria bacterium]
MSNSFLAGAAARSIMPLPAMVDNTLHLMITVRLDEPGSPPKAKALAMTLGRRSLMLIGLDLGGAGTAHAGALREAVSRATGLDVEDVVVSCTHTHYAAVLEPFDGEHTYFDLVVKATVDAAAEAWARAGRRRPRPDVCCGRFVQYARPVAQRRRQVHTRLSRRPGLWPTGGPEAQRPAHR